MTSIWRQRSSRRSAPKLQSLRGAISSCKRQELTEVVDPAHRVEWEHVFCGATVTVCDANGCESTYSIVGVDEADVAGGRIRWVSPLARALLKLREGEVAMLRTPTGINELEVTCIVYCELD